MKRSIIIKANPYLDASCQNFWVTRIKSHKHPGIEKQQETHTPMIHTYTKKKEQRPKFNIYTKTIPYTLNYTNTHINITA